MADSIEKKIDLSLDELIKQRKKESSHSISQKQKTLAKKPLKENRGAKANNGPKKVTTLKQKSVTRKAVVNKNRGLANANKKLIKPAQTNKSQKKLKATSAKNNQQQQPAKKPKKPVAKKALGNAARNLQQVSRTINKTTKNNKSKPKVIPTKATGNNSTKATTAGQSAKPRQVIKSAKGPKLQITIKRTNNELRKNKPAPKVKKPAIVAAASSVKGKLVANKGGPATKKPVKKPAATSKKVSKGSKFVVRKPFAARRK